MSSGRVELLRRGTPFWERLEARGIPTTIIRMPANFPPSGTATRELSGMGTPDLLGTYGTFAFYTSEPFAFAGRAVSGGVVHQVRVREGRVGAVLEGRTTRSTAPRKRSMPTSWSIPTASGGSPSSCSTARRLLPCRRVVTGCR